MTAVLTAAAAFPTVLYTVLLGIVVVYWLFVMLGALDTDALGEGIDADFDGGDVDVDGDGGDGGDGAGALSSWFGLRRVPLTISLSLVVLFGWTFTLLGMHWTEGVSRWVAGPIVFVAATLVAVAIAAVAVRPLAPVFRTHAGKTRADYIGSTCEISTGHVDATFGQATVTDGGTVLVIPVRCDKPDNGLQRGAHALVIDYDQDREAYVVEPYAQLAHPAGA